LVLPRKTFYAEFLAALHVVKNQNTYFPKLIIQKPIPRLSFVFPDYIHIRTAMSYFNMTRDEIATAKPLSQASCSKWEETDPKGICFSGPSGES